MEKEGVFWQKTAGDDRRIYKWRQSSGRQLARFYQRIQLLIAKMRSTKKLLNTSIEKIESSQGILTREQARKVGLWSARAQGVQLKGKSCVMNMIKTY